MRHLITTIFASLAVSALAQSGPMFDPASAPVPASAAVSWTNDTYGLVSWWTLDEGSGSVAHDASGNSDTGTIYGSPTWITGIITNGLSLTATGSEYVLGANTFNSGTATLSCWIKTSSAMSYNSFIMGCMDGASDLGTFDKDLYITPSGTVSWYLYSGTTKTVTSTTTVTDGNWHFIAGVCDGANMTLYIDAAPAATMAAGTSYAGYAHPNMYLSGTNGGSSAPWFGYSTSSLDDCRFYNRGLTAFEITNLFHLWSGK